MRRTIHARQLVIDPFEERAKADPEPVGDEGQGGERRDDAPVLDGTDEASREGGAEFRLGETGDDATATDLRAEPTREADRPLHRRMFSNS